VAKCRSPHRVANSKATRREQDDDCSSGDEEPVSGGSEYSTDASNYSEEDSVSCDSKEESGEEPTDAEEESDGKGLISTPVSRKGVTSDYDTPTADLLRHNRSAQKERNITKRGPKLSQRKRRGLQHRKRNTNASSNDNNEGALFNCCCFHHMSFCFLYRNFCNHYFCFSFFFFLFFGLQNIFFLIIINT
jgi:hypothetical protein